MGGTTNRSSKVGSEVSRSVSVYAKRHCFFTLGTIDIGISGRIDDDIPRPRPDNFCDRLGVL